MHTRGLLNIFFEIVPTSNRCVNTHSGCFATNADIAHDVIRSSFMN